MDFWTLWLIGSVITIPFAVHGLLRDMADAWRVGGEWVKDEPEGIDWFMSIFVGTLLSPLVWPIIVAWQIIKGFQNKGARHQLKLDMVRRRNDRAYRKLKEARACLLREKQKENSDACLAWSREWNAALKPAHDRRIAEKKEQDRLALEARRTSRQQDDEMFAFFLSQGHSRAEARHHSLMYDDLYGSTEVCRHGNSRLYHCYSCSR